MLALELDPMLETVAHASLPLLGDACAIDRLSGGAPTRVLEVRAHSDIWIEPAAELCALPRAEVRVDGSRSRMSLPITVAGDRFGQLTFVARSGMRHGSRELVLAEELVERLGLAIQNILAHAELRESVVERERLISVAAHELRGPTCSLRLCMQAMRRSERKQAPDNKDGGHASRLLEIMLREERRLSRLIDDLLDVARVRSGQLQLDLERVDLCGIVRDVVARMTIEAERVTSPLEVDVPPALVGQWDRARLDQVVTNLVGNAIKFGEGRPVSVRAESTPDGSKAILCVTDHGVGIEIEQQKRIFEPFKRAGEPKRYDGLGLGLYIVRNIVRELGGTVTVESAPGAGATFRVELPLRPEPRLRVTPL